jgi:transcriptional regulator with XRE-family HTH domain
MLTPSQCRAARGLLDWSQQQLATAARVGVVTVRQFEAGTTEPRNATLDVIQRALEAAGVVLVPENGGDAGVRLRRYRVGDLVRFRPSSHLRRSYDVEPNDAGAVVYVEPHPPQMGPTYRVKVQFPRALVEGVYRTEFELVKAAPGGE